MFGTTVIRRYITGIMQSSGGFAEPISRLIGVRVRTAISSIISLSHDDTNGTVESTVGKLILKGATTIETAQPFSAGGIFDGATRIPAPTSGLVRPVAPVLGQEHFDTNVDLDMWVKWNGIEWRSLTGVVL